MIMEKQGTASIKAGPEPNGYPDTLLLHVG
jgi:hypothetical protein